MSSDLIEMRRQAAARRSALLPAAVGSVLAATFGLTAAFDSLRWVPPVFLAVGLAFAVGWAARRLEVPAALSPAVSLVALVVFLGVAFFAETTNLGIPSGETVRAIGEAISIALEDIRTLAPPVEVTREMAMITAGAVFLIATVVDLVVFRGRRPASAGLPLLALYLVPASVRESGPGLLPFAIAAAGYVGLLIAEGRDRAKAWGRRLAGIGVVDELVDVSPVARVGRRIGAAAVCVALFVPVLVPDPGDGLLGGSSLAGGGLGNGPRQRLVINPIVQLRADLRSQVVREVMEVRTNEPEYLRLTTLDEFDGAEWTSARRMEASASDRVTPKDGPRRLPNPPGLINGEYADVSGEVEVGSLDVSWLPLPYAPVLVDVDGDWLLHRRNGVVFSARRTTKNLDYSYQARVPRPSRLSLQTAEPVTGPEASDFLRTPDAPPIVRGLLEKILVGAETPYERALAIQSYLRGPEFSYTLHPDYRPDANPLLEFLRTKEGYCEQFAATMAYFARLSGIPARVAIGFTPGSRRGDDGSYVVTNRDAHAWPELWFDGVGWVRFEPTPRSDDLQINPPGYATPADPEQPADPGEAQPSEQPTPSAEPTTSASADPDEVRDPELRDTATDPQGGGAGGGGIGWWMAGWVALALALGAVPAGLRRLYRSRRWRRAGSPVALANAAWADLVEDAEDLGYRLPASASPRAAAARLVEDASLTGEPAAAVTALGRAEERARYAPVPPSAEGLAGDVRTARRGLAGPVSRRRRVRAAVLPASALRRTRRVLDARRYAAARRWATLRRAAVAAVPLLRRGTHAG